jgi:hypothetical protein
MKNVKELLIEYPFLKARELDGSVLLVNGEPQLMGLEIPAGWHRVFLQLCEDIKPVLEREGLLDEFYFIQVKEKFNELRCYHSGATQGIEEIIAQYGYMAYFICTRCGAPATKMTTGYLASICDDCWKDKYRHQKIEHLGLVTEYELKRYQNGKYFTKIISFKDEWKRYLESISK